LGRADLPTEVLGARVVTGAFASTNRRDLALLNSPSGAVRVFADRTTAVVEVDTTARYLVEHGMQITVQPAVGASTTAVRAFLHATVAALVAAQQGRFALHASVVDLDGRRVAIAGPRGAGKSTTALAAVRAGADLVADDVAVLDGTSIGVDVAPYGRDVHVWRDVAHRLELDVSDALPVASGLDKLTLSVPGARPGPVDAVVVLVPGDTATPRLVTMDRMAAVEAVARHTYRLGLVRQLWASEVFTWQVTIARRVPVHRMVRPHEWSADAVVASLRSLVTELKA
jgi:hypothetical protein